MASVLIVDDEELIRWALAEQLRGQGHHVREADGGAAALEQVAAHRPDLVLLDVHLVDMSGLDVLRTLRSRDSSVPVIMLTADSAIDTAVEATQLGARTYLTKPFDLAQVGAAVDRLLEEDRRAQTVVKVGNLGRSIDLIGAAPSMATVLHVLQRLEKVDAPTVLLLGESGTGKDVVAHAIHTRGPRARGPFLDIDCASLPPLLIESELFGHEKGAFTDAREAKRGLLETAKGGIVFLDEIGELPLEVQAKLLRAMESRTFRRVGGLKSMPFDAALIAATNRNLAREVAEGRFREDLYFRLDVVTLRLPPLRERREDIPALVTHMVARCNQRFGREINGVRGDAMEALQAWSWPGNVRELRNVVERIAILSPDDLIQPEHLPAEIRFARAADGLLGGCPFTLPDNGVDLEAVERGLILQALERSGPGRAAHLLGLTQPALHQRLTRLGIATDTKPD